MRDWLQRRGADTVRHPGGTLYAHLCRVEERLAKLGHGDEVQAADRLRGLTGERDVDAVLRELRVELRRLELIGLTAVHDDGTLGATDVDLTIGAKELVLLLGQVGSGKSSLLAALAVIVGATGALLFALTRSLVVPVKAIVMNLATLAATLGVLVAVFQWGWGAGLLGFEPWGALDLTTPLLLFVFAFGLSMDYEVFLLARIKEEWDRRTGSDRAAGDRAVLAGITATGPVVTTAALAIGVVFLGFVVGGLVAVKEIGVGMAVAVLIDVTVVRGLLLPATMSLLGRWNWWRLGVSTAAPAPRVPVG